MGSVSVDRAWKRYGKVEAVKGLTLEVHDGELFSLLGPSGCGKTSTLRMIAGLEAISEGEIRIDGQRVNELPPRDRNVALAFEAYALYPHLTAYENIAFPLRVRGVPAKELDRRVREVAEMLNLSGVLHQRPRQLSGGQQQRLTVARALVRSDAAVYLLDEPLSHLDTQERVQLRMELKRIQHLKRLTMILVTHDQLEAMTMANRIAIMNLGELQQVGTPEQVYDEPANLFVANFIGEPPMNLLDCHLQVVDSTLQAIVVDQRVRLPEVYRALGSAAAGRRVVLGIRPSYVRPVDPTGDGYHLRGEVYVFESLGEKDILTVRVNEHLVRSELPGGEYHFSMGQNVALRFDPARTLLFDAETERRLVPV